MPLRPGLLRALGEAAEVLALTVGAALALKTFVVDAVHVPSASMEGTILAGDFLLVNKLVYRGIAPPRRGDVIVVRAPERNVRELYVKRLAALPGDTLRLRGGVLFLNGRGVPSPPGAGRGENAPPDFGPVCVPEDSCFVLGDNLDESLDSRAWGFVPMRSIVGRAFMVYWSIAPGGGIRWGRLLTMIR